MAQGILIPLAAESGRQSSHLVPDQLSFSSRTSRVSCQDVNPAQLTGSRQASSHHWPQNRRPESLYLSAASSNSRTQYTGALRHRGNILVSIVFIIRNFAIIHDSEAQAPGRRINMSAIKVFRWSEGHLRMFLQQIDMEEAVRPENEHIRPRKLSAQKES